MCRLFIQDALDNLSEAACFRILFPPRDGLSNEFLFICAPAEERGLTFSCGGRLFVSFPLGEEPPLPSCPLLGGNGLSSPGFSPGSVGVEFDQVV